MIRPHALAVAVETIPDTLRREPRWVLWRFESRDARWTKIPRQPSGHHAKTNDSGTWCTFEAVTSAYRSDHFDGIGFCLGDGWSGVDLDRCRDIETGALCDAARLVIETFESAYVEISPSETGIKILCRGDRIGFEIRYDKGGALVPWQGARFFAITGHGWGDPAVDRSQALDFWLPAAPPTLEQRPALWQDGDVTGTEHIPDPISVATVPDEELLDRARAASNREKFMRLWSGDHSAYASQSEADFALCMLLAFWTQRNAERVDRLFRRSGLYRSKWETASYRRSTLSKALAQTSEVYQPMQETAASPDSHMPGPATALVNLEADWTGPF